MPKIVDKVSRRKEIAMQAMELFAANGFDRTSVREITEAAGMGKGTFYDYFQDKHDLISEIAELIFSTWFDHFSRTLNKTDPPLKQLSIVIREGMSAVDAFEKFMMLYIDIWRLSVGSNAYESFHGIFKQFLSDTKKGVATIIERGIKDGSIRKDVDPMTVSASIIAFIDGLCLHYMIYKPDINIDTAVKGFYRILLEGIAAK